MTPMFKMFKSIALVLTTTVLMAGLPCLAVPQNANGGVSAGDDHTPLVPVLKELVFISTPEQIESNEVNSPVDASHVPDLDDSAFTNTLTAFLQRPLTLKDLERIKQQTSDWLRVRQLPFANISVPEQNVSSGVVHILVTEYKLGHIKVEGARHFSPSLITKASGLRLGSTLSLQDLELGLERLNRNPFLNVDAVFRPGQQTGETDIVLKAKDRLPLRLSGGYDTLGVRSLGIEEWNYGVSWGNVFGTGQIVSYQYTRAVSGRSDSHSLSDTIPLRWGDQILIFGSYGAQRPLLAEIFDDLGHSGQASLRYVHLLRHSRRFTQDLQLGYDFKTTDNNLAFAGFQVFSAQAQVDQFPVTYDVGLTEHSGQTTVQNIFVYSPGRITPDNTTAALSALVPGAAAHYIYNRFLLTRTTLLPRAFTAVTRATIQLTTRNLPYSEQIGGGGVGSVRGYYTDTALGSKGELFSQELRFPAFSPSRLAQSGRDFHDRAQFGVFFDYANLRQNEGSDAPNAQVGLASLGVLARYSVSRFIDVQYDLGLRLRRSATVPERGVYGQISLTGNF